MAMLNSLISLFSLLLLVCSSGHAADNKAQANLIVSTAPDAKGFLLGLELSPTEGWHTYWRNPGDAGLGTSLRWTLPQGVSAGATQWPAPKPYREGELMTYGFGSTHTLFSRLNIAQSVADDAEIAMQARWLICKDICIPESAKFVMTAGEIRNSAIDAGLIAEFQKLPEALLQSGHFASSDGRLSVFVPLPAHWAMQAEQPSWFIGHDRILQHAADTQWQRNEQGIAATLPLQDNAEVPAKLDGVIRLDIDGRHHALEVSLSPGSMPPDLNDWHGSTSVATKQHLGIILLMAFVGGLILNLMPCVFPVLTLKAMNLARAESLRHKRQESLAYTAGVVLSFLAIAGVLLSLRAGGAALGWGFQLQNPLVVGLLACLMVLLGLALLGWTHIGMSFMGVGQGLTQQHGVRGAFFTGVLAVIVASPCSAPFMGSALGYAVLQPAPIALGIFGALGLGLAAPFALLPWVPWLAHKLPKPGPWMETLKHWLALPMVLTAVWLFWVLWRQAGDAALLLSVAATTALAMGIRQKLGANRASWQKAATVAGVVLLSGPAWVKAPPPTHQDLDWTAWSHQEVAEAAERGQMVFVDFTADWCLSCIANEQAVIASDQVQELFSNNNVLMLKADWTLYDPIITAELARHGRNGVPLYLLYPATGGQPEILPQILTTKTIQRALEKLASG